MTFIANSADRLDNSDFVLNCKPLLQIDYNCLNVHKITVKQMMELSENDIPL